MSDFLFGYEPFVRAGTFLAIFMAMALWEWQRPRRPVRHTRRERWPVNLTIVVIDSLMLRVLFPVAAIGVALEADRQGWGLLNQTDWPVWLEVVLAFLLLDLAIYVQHRLFHRIPLLWRLHRMHHADPDIDVSTGIRFHPLEILLSMLIKMVVVAALGAPALAVLLFEIVLNATSLFNHSNIDLPTQWDRWLRRLLVTPDYHRVHHSRIPAETDSNFGFNLSFWDRLLGTYCAQPSRGHLGMQIGLDEYSDIPEEMRLSALLTQPFRGIPQAPGQKESGA